MRFSTLAVAGLAGLALGGCASRSAESAVGTGVSPDAAEGSAVRWTGSFAPTQQRTGEFAGTDRARTYGNATLSMSPRDRTRSVARLSFTVPSTVMNQSLRWAVLPGRCGSGAVPVMATNLFPPIEVGGNGRAEITTELPLAVPTSGSFHINVYWPGGDQLENVLTCTNLRREG